VIPARILAAVLLAACSCLSTAATTPRIAIIIDDLGYQLAAGHRAIALPGPVTCAILPGGPRARQLAMAANDSGKEVLLHLPMEAVDLRGDMEPSAITIDMSRANFAATLDSALSSVPHVVGINNHRGSLLTRHPGHMQWLMEEIGERDGLFFVDSYTTHHSVALQIAEESGVRAAKRDVFLDADKSIESIERELERAKQLARQRGFAIAIGHPYEVTLSVLERELPRLKEQGYRLVPVSELVSKETI
jgi:polysaccharide deacetylase 2 family uncharacterized protein YibQ